MAQLTPTQGQVGTAYDRPWYQFGFGEGDPSAIMAYYADPSAAGKRATFDEAAFYDYMRQAQAMGRGVGMQQQSLADALRARAEGRGAPSLAELQLAQTLDEQRKAAAGALAGAGRSINPALAQRLLLQQRASLGQQAAGQAAILRAQEQLAAQTALGNQLAQMRGAETAAFQQSGQLGLGQERLGVETQEAQRQRELDIALANQKAAQLASGQAQASEQFERTEARKTAGAVAGAVVEGAKAYNEGTKTPPTPTPAAQGGIIRRRYAEGGKVKKSKIIAAHAAAKKNMKSFTEQYGKEEGKDIAYATMMKLAKENKLAGGGGVEDILKTAIPALLLSRMGLPPELALAGGYAAKKGIDYLMEDDKEEESEKMAKGGKVKAAMGKLVKMDNEKNDTVPAMLSPGEIVIPRSIVNAPNAPLASAKFVSALLQNKDKKSAKIEALKAALGKK